MKPVKISASMMCADLANLQKTIEIFEGEKIDYLHIDVMDGEFVPNIGLGVDYIHCLRSLTSIPLDIHLMIQKPEFKFSWIGIQRTDTVSFHMESTFQVQRALDNLHKYGCKCFIAINPATPVSNLEEVLDDVDGINMLTVNPGFAGQKVVPSTLNKAEKLKDFLQAHNRLDLEIEVDGNITCENALLLKDRGANVFVAGTSSIFKGDVDNYRTRIREFRAALEDADR